MEAERCVRCGNSTIWRGQVTSAQEPYVARYFVPDHLRAFRPQPGVLLEGQEFRGCVACGHLWSSFEPAKLRDFVEKSGNELASQHLDEIDRGPFRDLPETSLGRSIGATIAELDALARDRKVGVVGRYRELAGVTWDEAIKVVGKWDTLTRPEKLAIFGWEPKKKVPIDEFF